MEDNSRIRDTLKHLRVAREQAIQQIISLNDVISNLSLMIEEPELDDWREMSDKYKLKLGAG